MAAHDGPLEQSTEARVAFSKPGITPKNKIVHGSSGSPWESVAAHGSPWQPVASHDRHCGFPRSSLWQITCHPVAARVGAMFSCTVNTVGSHATLGGRPRNPTYSITDACG